MAGALFVSGQDKLKVRRVVDCVEDGQNGTAGVAEDVLNAMPEHHLMKDLATGLADERVVKILFLDQGGRLVREGVPGGEDRRRGRSPKMNKESGRNRSKKMEGVHGWCRLGTFYTGTRDTPCMFKDSRFCLDDGGGPCRGRPKTDEREFFGRSRTLHHF